MSLLTLRPSITSDQRHRSVLDSLTGRVEEITAHDVSRGKDIQGIPFDKLPFSRANYRASRLRHRGAPPDSAAARARQPRRTADFFAFHRTSRRMRCTVEHNQLRNLCWAVDRKDVFGTHHRTIVHWDTEKKQRNVVLDLGRDAVAAGHRPAEVRVVTMIAVEDLVIAGGMDGEIVAKDLSSGTVVHSGFVTKSDNPITNSMDTFNDHVLISSNDGYVRCLDMESWQLASEFYVGSAVNHATRQPICKMVCAVGDDKVVHLLDGDTCRPITELKGHEDFSFATAWHPGGHLFATGSDDRTFRVWDVRNLTESLHVVPARKGSVRSLRFSPCGRFLAAAEQNDFVRVFATNGRFSECQEIDYFGELAGISFTPDSKSLFVAVDDTFFAGLIEYRLNDTDDSD